MLFHSAVCMVPGTYAPVRRMELGKKRRGFHGDGGMTDRHFDTFVETV